MADRIAVMNAGRVEQEGSAADLYERPDTLFVAGFIGSPPINLFDGEIEDGFLKVREVRLPLSAAAREAVLLRIRPESLRADGSGMPARILAAESMGRQTLYTADSPLGPIRFLEGGAAARHRDGDNVPLAFSQAAVLLFDKASGRRLDTILAGERSALK